MRVRLTLRAPNDKIAGNKPLLIKNISRSAIGFNPKDSTTEATIAKPLLWTSETPNIYDALVELLKDGKVIECRRADVGFRRVELHDKQFWGTVAR